MCELIINRRVIRALVASAAFAVAVPTQLAWAEQPAETDKSSIVVAAVQPSTAADASAPQTTAPEATAEPARSQEPAQLIRSSAMPQYYYPPYYSRPAPVVIRPAPTRRVVRRAPTRTPPAVVRAARIEAPPLRRVSLLGVGFGF